MKQRIVFRADASKRIGFGHFIRSLALANYLKNDFDCVFASYNQDSANEVMSGYQLSEICKVCTPAYISGITKTSFDEEFINELKPEDIAVLDNYYYDTEYQQRIKDKGCKLVYIDDMHRYHIVSDLLLTVCPLKLEDFSTEPYTKFVGGIEWALLREPFLKPLPNRTESEGISNVVLGMGGADAFNITDKMVGIVNDLLPEAELDIICGEGVELSPQPEKKVKVHRCLSAEDIVDLFDKADIGIFPASTISVEALSRRLPVIAGYYVDNQVEFYNYGVRNGYFSPGGDFLADPHKIENTLRQILGNPIHRAPQIDFTSQKQKYVNLFKTL